MFKTMTVTITKIKGSTPREVGASMIVTKDNQKGTIGGGSLEFHATAIAREMLDMGENNKELTITLGPILGQCCGGVVTLFFSEKQNEQAIPHNNFYLFGKGHVGLAMLEAIKPLPFNAYAYDEREGDDCLEGIKSAKPNAIFLIFTHSHTLDFILTEAALLRGDALYVGMIGSKTKRARFLQTRPTLKLDNFYCPIGFKSSNKRPEVISILTLAQILLLLSP